MMSHQRLAGPELDVGRGNWRTRIGDAELGSSSGGGDDRGDLAGGRELQMSAEDRERRDTSKRAARWPFKTLLRQLNR